MIKLYESYNQAYNDNSLNSVCMALYNLASAYSQFYNNVKVLKEENDSKRKSYLTLSKAVRNALVLGLNTLGIDAPERM